MWMRGFQLSPGDVKHQMFPGTDDNFEGSWNAKESSCSGNWRRIRFSRHDGKHGEQENWENSEIWQALLPSKCVMWRENRGEREPDLTVIRVPSWWWYLTYMFLGVWCLLDSISFSQHFSKDSSTLCRHECLVSKTVIYWAPTMWSLSDLIITTAARWLPCTYFAKTEASTLISYPGSSGSHSELREGAELKPRSMIHKIMLILLFPSGSDSTLHLGWFWLLWSKSEYIFVSFNHSTQRALYSRKEKYYLKTPRNSCFVEN